MKKNYIIFGLCMIFLIGFVNGDKTYNSIYSAGANEASPTTIYNNESSAYTKIGGNRVSYFLFNISNRLINPYLQINPYSVVNRNPLVTNVYIRSNICNDTFPQSTITWNNRLTEVTNCDFFIEQNEYNDFSAGESFNITLSDALVESLNNMGEFVIYTNASPKDYDATTRGIRLDLSGYIKIIDTEYFADLVYPFNKTFYTYDNPDTTKNYNGSIILDTDELSTCYQNLSNWTRQSYYINTQHSFYNPYELSDGYIENVTRNFDTYNELDVTTSYDLTMQNNGTFTGYTFNHGNKKNGVDCSNGYCEFDGVDDALVVDENRDFQFNQTDMTIALWFKKNENGESQHLISKEDGGSDGWSIYNRYNSDAIWFVVNNAKTYSTTAITDQDWHSFVATVDYSAGTSYVYIDGVDDSHYFLNVTLENISVSNSLTIGNSAYPSIGDFNGSLANIQISENNVWTQTDVTAFHNAGRNSPPLESDGLVGSWSMAENIQNSTHIFDTNNYVADSSNITTGARFDGNNQYILLNNDIVLNTTEGFSISFNAKAKTANRYIILGRNGFSVYSNLFFNGANFYFEGDTNGNDCRFPIQNDNAWHLYYFNVSKGFCSLKVDGVSITPSDAILNDDTITFNTISNLAYDYNGTIDNVIIWNRSLSAEEVALIQDWEYNPDSTLSDKLVLYNNFDILNKTNYYNTTQYVDGNYSLQYSCIDTYNELNVTRAYDLTRQNDGTFTGYTFNHGEKKNGVDCSNGYCEFDADSSNYISFDTTPLNYNNSLCFWIKQPVGSITGNDWIFSLNNADSNTRILMNEPSGKLYIQTGGAANNYLYTNTNVYDGDWHSHCVYTNEDANNMNWYVDGVLSNGVKNSNPTTSVQFNVFEIGDYAGTHIGFFNGSLDNIQIFDNEITQTEALAYHNAGRNSPPLESDGLVASWSMAKNIQNSTHIFDTNNYIADSSNITTGARFDGVDDYIDISSVKEKLGSHHDYSVSTTFLLNDIGSVKGIVTSSNNNSDFFTLGAYYNDIRCGAYDGSWSSKSAENILLPNIWYNVICMYNHSSDSITLYVDNVLYNGSSGATAGLGANTRIGSLTSGISYYDGTIDNVAIWNRSLSAEEVALVPDWEYNPYDTIAEDLMLYMPFDLNDTVEGDYLTEDAWFFMDTTQPNITYTTPNNDNSTVFNSTSTKTLNLDITTYDLFLEESTLTITNSTGGILYTNTSGNVTGDLYYNFTHSLNISTWPIGIYNITVSANDTVGNNNYQARFFYISDNYLKIYSPENLTRTNEDLNVSFEYQDSYLGDATCIFNVSGSGLIFSYINNSVQSSFNSNFYQDLTIDGTYIWNLSCIGNTYPFSNSSINNMYYFDANPPRFKNQTQDNTSIFPQIGDNITFEIDIVDNINISYCKLEINDTGVWRNDSTYFINMPNTHFNKSYEIQNYSITANATIGWKVWCNDTTGNSNESEVSLFKVIDITNPIVIINPTGNNWNTNNLTVIGSYLYNLTYNITFADNNLFQTSVNVTCDKNGTIYYWEVLDWNVTSVNKFDNVSLYNMEPQECQIYFSASDDHTKTTISKYEEVISENKVKYLTTEKINIEIEANDITEKIKTKKLNDRYNFNFNYDEKKLERSFIIKSDQRLFFQEESDYPAHFVAWNEQTKSGNWIDFMTDEYTTRDYIVNKISDYEYEIIIKSKIPKQLDLKEKKKGFLGLIGEPMTRDELIVDEFGIENFKFKSLGGTNLFNVSYIFYVGGTVNATGINIFDNSSIEDWSVKFTTLDSYPGLNQTETITGNTAFLTNISNGTYSLEFFRAGFFNQTYLLNMTGVLQNLTYESYQSILNIQAENVLTNILQTGLNYTLSDGYTNISTINTTTNTTTYYLNATTWSITVDATGYQQLNTTYTTLNETNHTLLLSLGFLATFNLFDEKILAPFNMSSPDSVVFLLYCSNQTLQTTITNETEIIPIGCQFEKYKFVLTYGLTSYYRTFLTDYEGIINNTIYLINLDTTQSIFNSFIVDDLYSEYEDISIHVFKTIEEEQQLITADYVDIENKVGAFLIENNEYYIEVHSSNQPTRILGSYSADIAGDKNLRLYDISLSAESSGINNDLLYAQGTQNISGDLYTVATFEDLGDVTTSVTYTVWENSYASVPIYQISTAYNNTAIEFLYNASPYTDSTLISQLSIIYLGSYHNTTKIVSAGNQKLDLNPLNDGYISRTFLNWFFTILLGIFAIMGTIKTANKHSMALIGVAGFFVLFGWYELSWSVLVLSFMISLFSIIKEGDQNMSRL